MEKREVLLYGITFLSLVGLISLFFMTVSKIPNIADEKFISLTGNVVLDFEENFKIGDNVRGDIYLGNKDSYESVYGFLLLTKEDEPIVTKTFYLSDFLFKDSFGNSIVKVEDLINYPFIEQADYELLFSVLDLDINIKREIIVL